MTIHLSELDAGTRALVAQTRQTVSDLHAELPRWGLRRLEQAAHLGLRHREASHRGGEWP